MMVLSICGVASEGLPIGLRTSEEFSTGGVVVSGGLDVCKVSHRLAWADRGAYAWN